MATETAERLRKCFAAVFPEATSEQILEAEQASFVGWDSMASLTLFALIEEEFQIQLDAKTLDKFTSFKEIRRALEMVETNRWEPRKGG